MIFYINGSSGYVTVDSLSNGQNVSVKFIPLNVNNATLTSGTHIVTNTNTSSGSYLIIFN